MSRRAVNRVSRYPGIQQMKGNMDGRRRKRPTGGCSGFQDGNLRRVCRQNLPTLTFEKLLALQLIDKELRVAQVNPRLSAPLELPPHWAWTMPEKLTVESELPGPLLLFAITLIQCSCLLFSHRRLQPLDERCMALALAEKAEAGGMQRKKEVLG